MLILTFLIDDRMSKSTTSQLADGVQVIVTQNKNPPSVSFEIDNQLFATLNFTLDITGSKNLWSADEIKSYSRQHF